MRASSANRVACTGSGNVMVASMLSVSALRKVRVMTTIARPASIVTSKRVDTSGQGRGVPATKAPAMKAWSGSIIVCDAIGICLFLQQIGEQLGDTLDQRTRARSAAEQVGIDHQRHSRRDHERGALARVEQQLDGGGRKSQFAQPGVTADRDE